MIAAAPLPPVDAAANLRAAMMMIAAMAGFAVEDAIIKALSVTLPTGQILMTIGAGGTLAFTLIARAQGHSVLSMAFFNRVVLLRNAGELFGTAGFVTALSLAPLTVVSAILQASPLAVTAAAALILGEKVGPRRWAAVLAGLMGVLMVIQPGSADFVPASLFAVMAVFGLAMRDIVTRRVPTAIPTTVVAAYAFATTVPTGAILLAFSGTPVPPQPDEWVLLIGGSAIGVIAYYAVTSAMRLGEISFVNPFRYTRMIFALAIGIAVFGERPNALTFAGIAVIVASGLYALLREARLRRSARRAPTLV
jgi:drug/metabolite transporter (DMT)-like permease